MFTYLPPRELPESGGGDGDGRIDMTTGDMSNGHDNNHDSETGASGDANERDGAVSLLINYGSGSAHEDKDESADELSGDLPNKNSGAINIAGVLHITTTTLLRVCHCVAGDLKACAIRELVGVMVYIYIYI